MATYKGVEINLKPTEGMAAEARKFKKWREEGEQGGTAVARGRSRARRLTGYRRHVAFNWQRRLPAPHRQGPGPY